MQGDSSFGAAVVLYSCTKKGNSRGILTNPTSSSRVRVGAETFLTDDVTLSVQYFWFAVLPYRESDDQLETWNGSSRRYVMQFKSNLRSSFRARRDGETCSSSSLLGLDFHLRYFIFRVTFYENQTSCWVPYEEWYLRPGLQADRSSVQQRLYLK